MFCTIKIIWENVFINLRTEKFCVVVHQLSYGEWAFSVFGIV